MEGRKEKEKKKGESEPQGVEIREQRAGEGKEKEEHGSVRVEVVINYSLKCWVGEEGDERWGERRKWKQRNREIRLGSHSSQPNKPAALVGMSFTYLPRSFIHSFVHLFIYACKIKQKGKTCFQYMECK